MIKRFKDRSQAEQYIDNITIPQLRELLIECLMQPEPEPLKKISISPEQLRLYFKVTGVTETGEVERRGRPKKEAR